MSRILFCGLTAAVFAIGVCAQEVLETSTPEQSVEKASAAAENQVIAALDRGEVETAASLVKNIESSAAQLYVQALSEREEGRPKQAIQTASQVVSLHSTDRQWMAKTELLIAELYLELGMLDSAAVTARQVQTLYKGMDVEEKAAALILKIEQLKEVSE